MPTYMCHGFRWKRAMIRIFVIMEDLDDASPDWIVGKTTSRVIQDCFASKFDFLPKPALARQQQHLGTQEAKDNDEGHSHQDDNISEPSSKALETEEGVSENSGWSPVKLLEEHDPEDLTEFTRPFAYVADHAIRIDLGVDMEEEKAKYEARTREINADGWLEKLRDVLQQGEGIGWYVVVCGDEERFVPARDDDGLEEEEEEEEEGGKVVVIEADDEEEQGEGKEPSQQGSEASASRDEKEKGKPQGRPSLRHRLSTAGLRRLFRKKESPIHE